MQVPILKELQTGFLQVVMQESLADAPRLNVPAS
jgi:hypothetical protein